MSTIDELKQKLEEYRLSRPSDISGAKSLAGNDMRSMMKNIKSRIVKGEKRNKIVKDELVKFWKKKGSGAKKNIIKSFKEDSSLAEGGAMFDGTGTIHISEVPDTLAYVERLLNMPGLKGNTLGSTGKKEFSGDVDIAVPYKDDKEIDDAFKSLSKALGSDKVKRQGKMISLMLPIQSFDPSKGEGRTGSVQTDLLFSDDPKWMTFFYHSSPNTKSKGLHRNIAISSVAAHIDRKESTQHDDMGRPLWIERWKWSPNVGLVKIKRLSYKNKQTGNWVKKQKDVEIEDPVRDPKDVAAVLFNGKANADALDSVETIVSAVTKSYDKSTAEQIFQTMATGFKQTHQRQNMNPSQFEFPPEIQKYM